MRSGPQASGLSGDAVVAAYDLMTAALPRPGYGPDPAGPAPESAAAGRAGREA